jgi:hypothetical protein
MTVRAGKIWTDIEGDQLAVFVEDDELCLQAVNYSNRDMDGRVSVVETTLTREDALDLITYLRDCFNHV